MKKNGFTLIELLVIIAIIAIIGAMLLPVFSIAKKKAQEQRGKQYQPVSQQVEAVDTPKIGDLVVVSGINVTGVVNNVSPIGGFDILTSDGKRIDAVNFSLLKKIQ